jgi:lysophospholipase L1-like esterase
VIPWSCYVAIGDSLTEGVGDPIRGELHGWADRLARSLRQLDPSLRYHNLARRSLTTAEVLAAQLGPALELQPDLVSIVVGMNDLLARRFDGDDYRASLSNMVTTVQDSGATVLMGTFPRDLPLLRLMPRGKARAMRDRLQTASEIVLDVASENDAVCIDVPEPWRYTMSECSIDGCHPNARGHTHIAELAVLALSERAGFEAPPFARYGCAWPATSVGHLRWLAAEGFLNPRTLVAQMRRAFAD